MSVTGVSPQSVLSDALRRVITGGEISFFLVFSSELSSSSVSGPGLLAYTFQSRLESGDAIFVKLGTNHQNKLQNLRGGPSSVTVVSTNNLRKASAVGLATSKFTGLIT